jgi:catalase
MFWNSQTDVEKLHIVQAFQFELSKVVEPKIRERMISVLQHVDRDLAKRVADGLGIKLPVKTEEPINLLYPADREAKKDYQPVDKKPKPASSKALSIIDNHISTGKGRKVAVLVGDAFDAAAVNALKKELSKIGAKAHLVAVHAGDVTDGAGSAHPSDFYLASCGSVSFDGVFIPGGKGSIAELKKDARSIRFVNETYKHCKTIGAAGEGKDFVENCLRHVFSEKLDSKITSAKNGVCIDESAAHDFAQSLLLHRCWERLDADKVPV